MYDDPIVTEVRETREKLLAEAGGFDAYVRKLKAMEQQDVVRIVSERPAPRETQCQAAKKQG